tara:strand:+ start:2382 stop:3296 length:915 start_codon:yes stop_codon:yes gene_type:complete
MDQWVTPDKETISNPKCWGRIGARGDQTSLCDTHVQLFGPGDKYPGQSGEEFAVDGFGIEEYCGVAGQNNIRRSILVQPDWYGNDHCCLVDSISLLNDNDQFGCVTEAKGIGSIGVDIEDAQLEDLQKAGLVGTKFIMEPGKEAFNWDAADRLAWRIYDFGWDVQLQMDGSDLHEVEQRIGLWPGRVVFNHIGMFLRTKKTQQRGFASLTRLIDRDKAWVKLSAPYLVSSCGAVDDPEVSEMGRALIEWAPERMVWGSNWPHLEKLEAPPETESLLKVMREWIPEESRFNLIMWENPAVLYGFT